MGGNPKRYLDRLGLEYYFSPELSNTDKLLRGSNLYNSISNVLTDSTAIYGFRANPNYPGPGGQTTNLLRRANILTANSLTDGYWEIDINPEEKWAGKNENGDYFCLTTERAMAHEIAHFLKIEAERGNARAREIINRFPPPDPISKT